MALYSSWLGVIACADGTAGSEASGQLVVPEAVDLGDVPATAWNTATVTVEAIGTVTLERATVESGRGWYGPGQASSLCGTTPMAGPVAKTTLPRALEDGEALTIELGFGGTAPLPPASLALAASDADHAVTLNAEVRAPLLDLSTVDFGEVATGETSDPRVLHVTPAEGLDLCLNDVLGLGDLALSTPPPVLVPAEGGVDLTLTWTPSARGPYYGQVSLVFGEVAVLALVSGRGVE